MYNYDDSNSLLMLYLTLDISENSVCLLRPYI